MQLPDTPSSFLLGYLLVFMPYAAVRSAGRLRANSPDPPTAGLGDGETGRRLTRTAVWYGTLFNLAIIGILAWFAGRGFDFAPLTPGPMGGRELLLALAALALCFGLRMVARWVHPPDRRRQMTVFRIAPRSRQEQVLWVAAVFAAGFAEELAYRGVGWTILTSTLGNAWFAAIILAAAFAVAHWTQGWKSGLVILGMALMFHGLVALTGTLILAMVVHTTYDLVAGELIRREAVALDHSPATA